jgi:hypothetical protein
MLTLILLMLLIGAVLCAIIMCMECFSWLFGRARDHLERLAHIRTAQRLLDRFTNCFGRGACTLSLESSCEPVQ